MDNKASMTLDPSLLMQIRTPRTPTACERCHRRHKKCDPIAPGEACRTCVELELPCSYPQTSSSPDASTLPPNFTSDTPPIVGATSTPPQQPASRMSNDPNNVRDRSRNRKDGSLIRLGSMGRKYRPHQSHRRRRSSTHRSSSSPRPQQSLTNYGTSIAQDAAGPSIVPQRFISDDQSFTEQHPSLYLMGRNNDGIQFQLPSHNADFPPMLPASYDADQSTNPRLHNMNNPSTGLPLLFHDLFHDHPCPPRNTLSAIPTQSVEDTMTHPLPPLGEFYSYPSSSLRPPTESEVWLPNLPHEHTDQQPNRGSPAAGSGSIIPSFLVQQPQDFTGQPDCWTNEQHAGSLQSVEQIPNFTFCSCDPGNKGMCPHCVLAGSSGRDE